jgi:peptide/nickel transport system permease protein
VAETTPAHTDRPASGAVRPDVAAAPGQPAGTTSARALAGTAGPRFFRSRRAVGGLFVLLLIALAVAAAPLIAPTGPLEMNPRIRLVPPLQTSAVGSFHLLGTDQVGRDLLSRVLYGGRISLSVALGAILLGGSFGVAVGLLAGFYGRGLDAVAMRLADLQLAIPTVLLAIAIVAVVGRDLVVLTVILAVSTWIVFARTVRGTTLALRETAFVEAARAAGASDGRIIALHILRNAWTPIIVLASQQVALMIILESSLSFIGAGAPATAPSWGSIVADGRDYVLSGNWWLTTFPGLAIALSVLAINFFGDGLRDVLDPRLRL